MQLVLLRHGESQWNLENRFTGWTDVELSDTGRQEAAAAGKAMQAAGLDFDVCFTSYLKRAIHTLNLALSQMDRDWLPVEKSWKLNERHYGALQGLNKAETAERYGEEQVHLWRRSYDVRPPELAADVMHNGIYITGGGSLLYGMDQMIASELGIPVLLSKEPTDCAALGLGNIIENYDLLQHLGRTSFLHEF